MSPRPTADRHRLHILGPNHPTEEQTPRWRLIPNLWRAQYVVNSVAEPGFMPFARQAFKRLLTGFPLVG
jgi:hypothetical protein